ncbi:hypothetical protein COV04_02330 [Candidatus Uhrbacteria bacterium CG10_big_fil_rev_8_21_14_0_10_48_11]|uniref:DUF4870 domain-containing protein n=1 Tax=Candidatus Uhrbacteria bacterium CG10_big_fil_rev_8_21_14_0_10_48_11 TaxID=1975037 RepID=A0A2M8LET8_9BACT|nr:MAG: hypothetical protein COV04_02330 [Candidatus Uhrbacteria bacterium CG10_big_fil_rev_8_21_14_0_10_48_11]
MPRTQKKKQSAVSSPVVSRPDERDWMLAAVSYLWIFCVIPLVLRKGSPFVQFHAKQGAVLAITWFLLWVVGIIPILGWLVFFFGSILLVAVNLLAIVRAWHGDQWKIPYLYDYVAYLDL